MGLEALYDIVNVHFYAQAEPWPTFRRSYLEDPAIEFLASLAQFPAAHVEIVGDGLFDNVAPVLDGEIPVVPCSEL